MREEYFTPRILDGLVTYELMAGFWPTADADPSSTGPTAEFAGIWRDMPKIVFSRTLERAEWNTTVVRDVIVDEILELKAKPGGDLVLGGADLAATFMRHDLIDDPTAMRPLPGCFALAPAAPLHGRNTTRPPPPQRRMRERGPESRRPIGMGKPDDGTDAQPHPLILGGRPTSRVRLSARVRERAKKTGTPR
ncbi:dihydrofolate reductase family protein [Microtetraspora sp. NBRC 16547]|uniref:dihydrofolate reductase family protein n=1 Tax=Microtetraspora sp. NBRC 16547 TaxID=3030993 RepID=UPI0025542EA0|nr:dihydrofolate reductase family protein [Microtetraspora sp. NBRC 16547]